jgi:hypothetical protein
MTRNYNAPKATVRLTAFCCVAAQLSDREQVSPGHVAPVHLNAPAATKYSSDSWVVEHTSVAESRKLSILVKIILAGGGCVVVRLV